MVDWPDCRTVGVVLYPGFDLLDATGPLHAFGLLKNVFEPILVGPTEGPVASAQGPALHASFPYKDAPELEMLLVPGGAGSRKVVQDESLMRWLGERARSAQIVMSVSAGAGLLAATGVLDGHKATTSSRATEWVESQGPNVRWVRKARFVDDGAFLSSAGNAAGLDMALHLVTRLTAPDVGQNLARSLEHCWLKNPDTDPFAGTK